MPAKPRNRLIPRSESERIEIVKLGHNKARLSDVYVKLLDASWSRLLVIIILSYFALNFLFAGLYFSFAADIENARSDSFWDAFFFSVQTLATIGYGRMAPVGAVANVLVTIEALTGFAFYAVVTGLVFAKFSRPTARVLFSDKAVICSYNGVPHLMLRLANERGNRIVDAKATLTLLKLDKSVEGHQMRRFHDLQLVRERVPLLRLTWTVMHALTKDSPLYEVTPEFLQTNEVEVVVSLSGVDETLSQTIYARHSYVDNEILCGYKFKDILSQRSDNRLEVNYELFHEVEEAKCSAV